ncbi:zinc-transporting ATPase [Pseudothermotoga hypogea DSM 11164 = NBRC 106472]|uniref:Zinc-transporting ATPase n=2 Tax=Pseudothermotoga TaxID=1643951 RepID=A0A0X1KSE5_9THEM|nr:heavy metal translocating P-type ATPase [Pseudothermotoga hypogea]AJC74149.1 zinc-transporting ATPase [Pseudothermotoga hypogea DSM 11164 = NBRC 106472]
MESCEVCHVDHKERRSSTLFLLILSGSSLLVSLLMGKPQISLFAYLLSGFEVFKKTIKNFARLKFFDENSLMSIATLGALFLGEFPEAATVMVLYRFGEFIEHYTIDRSRREMKKLLTESPRYAWRLKQDSIEQVHVDELMVGDVVLVRLGEKVPSDGIVVEGSAQINVSHLTGEPLPQAVTVGENVYAGSIVENGTLKVKISKRYRDSSMARVVELVQKAQERKTKAERFITKFARYYTPAVVIGAVVLIFVLRFVFALNFSESLYRSLILLVISCPCALVLSVPLTYVAALGKASRKGIFLKGAQYLDAIADVENVVFDKTGTLTETTLELASVEPQEGFSRDEVLFLAAHAALGSNHPLSRTLSESFKVNASLLKDSKEIPGLGVKAVVADRLVHLGNDRFLHEEHVEHPKSVCEAKAKVVHLGVDGQYAGTFVFKEKLKNTAQETVKKLRQAGLKVYVMSGDSEGAVKEVTENLGQVQYFANLRPEDKLALLEERIMKDGTTMFVGDGVNDAPALSRSNVGVAMNSLGNDSAIEIADAVLMNAEPIQVWHLFTISKRTRWIVLQNIVLAIGTKVAFMILAAMGKATMWQGVFADTGVMILCTFNAFRLLFSSLSPSVSKSGTGMKDNF